jgi:hypothetical protein
MVPRPISAGVSVYGALLMHRSLSGSAFSRSPMLARSRKRAASASSPFIRHSPNRRYLTDCPRKRSFFKTTRATSACAASADTAVLDPPRHASRSGGGSAVRYPKGRSSAQRLMGEYPEPPSPARVASRRGPRLSPLFDRGDHAFVPPSAAVYFRSSYSRSSPGVSRTSRRATRSRGDDCRTVGRSEGAAPDLCRKRRQRSRPR